MTTIYSKSGIRLDQTKNQIPVNDDNEALWQQLMVFNYLLFETADALEQERAYGQPTPLNQSWQGFMQQLLIKKPQLRTCLDSLLGDQGGVQ